MYSDGVWSRYIRISEVLLYIVYRKCILWLVIKYIKWCVSITHTPCSIMPEYNYSYNTPRHTPV